MGGGWENDKEIVKKARQWLENIQKARKRSGGLCDVDIKHFIKQSPPVTGKVENVSNELLNLSMP